MHFLSDELIKNALSYSPETGVLGVVCVNERWIARITVGRKEKYLGSFDTSDQASAAYLSAKRSMHEGCTL